jgi:hypothetical protein
MVRVAQSVYDEYAARRVGVLRALTTEVCALQQAVLQQQQWWQHKQHLARRLELKGAVVYRLTNSSHSATQRRTTCVYMVSQTVAGW